MLEIVNGLLNTTALVVPGVYVEIISPTITQLNGVPSNIAGMVGTASYGPTNTPVAFGNYAEFVANFANLNARTYDLGTHAAICIQQGANAMYGVRVTDGTDTAASGSFGFVTPNYAVLLTAKNTGSAGNSFTATFTSSAVANSLKLTLVSGLNTPEVYDGITTVSETAFWNAVVAAVNTGNSRNPSPSNYFVATAGSLVGSTAIPTPGAGGATITLSGGTDGTTFATSVSTTCNMTQGAPGTVVDVTSVAGVAVGDAMSGTNVPAGAKVASINTVTPSVTMTIASVTPITNSTAITFTGPTPTNAILGVDGGIGLRTGMYALRGTGCSMVDLCDVTSSSAWPTMITYGLSEQSYMITSGPAGDNIANAVTTKLGAGVDSYALKVMFGDWVTWLDTVNNAQRLVSPAPFVAGRLANLPPQNSALNQEIYAIIATQATAANQIYSYQDLTNLINAGIDVITNPSAGGQPFYACASGHNAASSNAIWGDNYTRMTNFLAVTIVAGGTGQFVGQPITPTLLRQEKAVIDNSLRNMKDAVPPMIADYQTTFVQTPTQQDNGIVIIQALVKYLAIEEKLVVALQGGQTVDIQRQGTGA